MGSPSESFVRLVERLSAASVTHRWEAYRDVAWDDPSLQVDGEDPRWQLPEWDPLGGSDWYLDQAEHTRSRLGLVRVVTLLKVGIEFETVLQRGLLGYASGLPDRHPAFRYVHHEITEEAQHSMMFQEFVNRSGIDVPRSSDRVRGLFGPVADDVRGGWSMFFLAALTAEEVFDQLQRRFVKASAMHPLFRRISEIHITEEARHLTFARAFLREAVPRAHEDERRLVRLRSPFMVDWMTRHILFPEVLAESLNDAWGMPPDAQETVISGPLADELRRCCASGVVELCEQLGIVDHRLAARWADLEQRPNRNPSA